MVRSWSLVGDAGPPVPRRQDERQVAWSLFASASFDDSWMGEASPGGLMPTTERRRSCRELGVSSPLPQRKLQSGPRASFRLPTTHHQLEQSISPLFYILWSYAVRIAGQGMACFNASTTELPARVRRTSSCQLWPPFLSRENRISCKLSPEDFPLSLFLLMTLLCRVAI